MSKSGHKIDHRVRMTRRMFRQALTELMREKPIQSITVRELCDAAGVNRGTFYAHYRDIFDLLGQIEGELFEQLEEALERYSEEERGVREPEPFSIFFVVFSFLRENADFCALLLREGGDKRFVRRVFELGWTTCEQVYRAKYPSIEPDKVRFFYTFVASGCLGLMTIWFEEGMEQPIERIAVALEKVIERGAGYLAEANEPFAARGAKG